MSNKILYLFKNTRSVILAQKAIESINKKCLILPVPRNISSECGMCIEANSSDEIYIDEIFNNKKIIFNKSDNN